MPPYLKISSNLSIISLTTFLDLATTKIVLSPATVPNTSFQSRTSIASATAEAVPEDVLITIMFSDAAKLMMDSLNILSNLSDDREVLSGSA